MKIETINNVRIDAIYACLPDTVLDNEIACKEMYGENIGTLIKSVGIRKRCVVSQGISSLDLCCFAAKRLLDDMTIPLGDVGAVIAVTFTPDQLMPCNAVGAQSLLGLPTNTIAFDINLACSGYGYGVFIAALLAKQLNKKVLLLDGDVQSAFVSPFDKGTAPVMADAGTATLISPCDKGDDWFFAFHSDGSGRDVLSIKAGGSKKPITADALEYRLFPDGSRRRDIDISMDGFGIFSFVAQTVTLLIKDFLGQTQTAIDSVDAFVPHQANIYMIRQLAKKLKISQERLWISGDEVGNSASATVPVTLAYIGCEGFLKQSNRVLFSGFGAGLSVSIGLVTIVRDARLKILNYQK